jgi:hypothetical protein
MRSDEDAYNEYPWDNTRKDTLFCFLILSIIHIYEAPSYNLDRGYEFRERMRIFGTGYSKFLPHSFLQS